MSENINSLIKKRFGETIATDAEIAENSGLVEILKHRSHRSFTDKQVSAELLQVLFAAALSAPSKSDLQQIAIIHIADETKKQKIAELIPGMPWISQASVLLVFCGDNRRIRKVCELRDKPFANDHLDSFLNAAVDTGLVLMNFIRAAESVGLGCCPISVIRNHVFAIAECLELPEWVFPVAGLALGYPAGEGQISPRLSPSTTVHTDSYDDSQLASQLDEYDQRRHAEQPIADTTQRAVRRYGKTEFYGWSEDKARQVSRTERADLGAFIRQQKFSLE